jgi:hypothetical protein
MNILCDCGLEYRGSISSRAGTISSPLCPDANVHVSRVRLANIVNMGAGLAQVV